MQIISPHLTLTESETLGMEPHDLVLTSPANESDKNSSLRTTALGHEEPWIRLSGEVAGPDRDFEKDVSGHDVEHGFELGERMGGSRGSETSGKL